MSVSGRSPESDLRRQARDRVGAKLSFLVHLVLYIAVNVFLVTVNLLSTPEHLWFYWPMLGWGAGLLSHGAYVLLPPRWKAMVGRMEERELRKLQGD